MFRKSTHSMNNGNCVEISEWRKSSLSYANGNCVEVGQATSIGIRDTKEFGLPSRTTLEFSAEAWSSFVTDIKRRAINGAYQGGLR